MRCVSDEGDGCAGRDRELGSADELKTHVGLDAVALPSLGGRILGIDGVGDLFRVRIEVFRQTQGFSESTVSASSRTEEPR